MAMRQLGRITAIAFSTSAKAAAGRGGTPVAAASKGHLSSSFGASGAWGHTYMGAPAIRHFSSGVELPGGGRVGLWARLKQATVEDYLFWTGGMYALSLSFFLTARLYSTVRDVKKGRKVTSINQTFE